MRNRPGKSRLFCPEGVKLQTLNLFPQLVGHAEVGEGRYVTQIQLSWAEIERLIVTLDHEPQTCPLEPLPVLT